MKKSNLNSNKGYQIKKTKKNKARKKIYSSNKLANKIKQKIAVLQLACLNRDRIKQVP